MQTKFFILALFSISFLFLACSENEIEKESIILSNFSISVKGVPSSTSVTFVSNISTSDINVERYGHCIYTSEDKTDFRCLSF